MPNKVLSASVIHPHLYKLILIQEQISIVSVLIRKFELL